MPPVATPTPRRCSPSARACAFSTIRGRVVAEGRLRRLLERDGLGRHDVRQRAAEHGGAALVDGLGELARHSTMPPRGPRRVLWVVRRDDVGVRDRVVVAGEDLAGDEAGEVRHVDHEHGADLVGHLAHPREVDRRG